LRTARHRARRSGHCGRPAHQPRRTSAKAHSHQRGIRRPANRAAFGGPVKNGRPEGFPQARVVTLTECGTHAQIDAAVGGFNGGEPESASKMADAVAGMLVIMDRGFPGAALWKAYTGTGAHQ
jgi:hypothetical protein